VLDHVLVMTLDRATEALQPGCPFHERSLGGTSVAFGFNQMLSHDFSMRRAKAGCQGMQYVQLDADHASDLGSLTAPTMELVDSPPNRGGFRTSSRYLRSNRSLSTRPGELSAGGRDLLFLRINRRREDQRMERQSAGRTRNPVGSPACAAVAHASQRRRSVECRLGARMVPSAWADGAPCVRIPAECCRDHHPLAFGEGSKGLLLRQGKQTQQLCRSRRAPAALAQQ
jgi:hypothetical protein